MQRALIAFLAAVVISGCGPNALQQHATAAVVFASAIAAADDLADSGGELAIANCTVEDCVTNVMAATHAIDATIASLRLLDDGYMSAIHLAEVAGSDADLIGALVVTLMRMIGGWGNLEEPFRLLGVELPVLPASITSLGGAL